MATGSVQALDVYRCVRSDGVTVYSEKPCGPDAEIESVNERPAYGEGRAKSPSAIQQLENYRRNVERINRLTGSDKGARQRNEEPCDTVTSLQLRNARVSKNLMQCHSSDDVRHMYGEPDSVYTWSDKRAYDTRYLYRITDDSRLYVFFKDDRVTKWNTRQ